MKRPPAVRRRTGTRTARVNTTFIHVYKTQCEAAIYIKLPPLL